MPLFFQLFSFGLWKIAHELIKVTLETTKSILYCFSYLLDYSSILHSSSHTFNSINIIFRCNAEKLSCKHPLIFSSLHTNPAETINNDLGMPSIETHKSNKYMHNEKISLIPFCFCCWKLKIRKKIIIILFCARKAGKFAELVY